jgi:hypothetical protein
MWRQRRAIRFNCLAAAERHGSAGDPDADAHGIYANAYTAAANAERDADQHRAIRVVLPGCRGLP